MRKAENKVKIEGILSETDLKDGSFVRNGEAVETIGGTIKIQVNQVINGENTISEIPVHMFAAKYTNAGKPNPAYDSIKKVKDEFVSIQSGGSAERADKVRISSGELRMNEFWGKNGKFVATPRIHASFISKAIGEFRPEATFSLEFIVSSIKHELDADGIEVEPTRLAVEAIVPQYQRPGAEPNVDLIPLVAVTPSVINAIESYWEAGACYKAIGRLNFSSRTEQVVTEQGFGESKSSLRTISTNELVLTGGSQTPIDEAMAFDMDEIKAGMAARKVRIDDLKTGKQSTNKQAPAPNKGKLSDLGF